MRILFDLYECRYIMCNNVFFHHSSIYMICIGIQRFGGVGTYCVCACLVCFFVSV